MPKKEQRLQKQMPVRPQAEPASPEQPAKISFDAWWAMMAKKLPPHHNKEVVLADFKARGFSMNETMADYSKALGLYGLKLK